MELVGYFYVALNNLIILLQFTLILFYFDDFRKRKFEESDGKFSTMSELQIIFVFESFDGQ